MSHNNHNKTIKKIGVICLSGLVFVLIYNALLSGSAFNSYRAYGGTLYGYGIFNTLNVILALIIKLLFLSIVAAGVVGIAVALKNQNLGKGNLGFINELIDNDQHQGHFCAHCHSNTKYSWIYCPYCGFLANSEIKNSKPETQEAVINQTKANIIEASTTEISAANDNQGIITYLESNPDDFLAGSDKKPVESLQTEVAEDAANNVRITVDAAQTENNDKKADEQQPNAAEDNVNSEGITKTVKTKKNKTEHKKDGKIKK